MARCKVSCPPPSIARHAGRDWDAAAKPHGSIRAGTAPAIGVAMGCNGCNGRNEAGLERGSNRAAWPGRTIETRETHQARCMALVNPGTRTCFGTRRFCLELKEARQWEWVLKGKSEFSSRNGWKPRGVVGTEVGQGKRRASNRERVRRSSSSRLLRCLGAYLRLDKK